MSKKCVHVFLFLLLLFSVLTACNSSKVLPLPVLEPQTVIPWTTTTEPSENTTEQTTTLPKYLQKEPKTKKEKLRYELELQLLAKDFPEEAKTFIRECFKQLYKNYPTWRTAYKDLPGREEYIRDNLINVIPNIPEIEMVKTGTARAKYLEDVAPALTEDDFRVRVVYEDPSTVSEEQHLSDLELLLHEFAHCETPNVFNPAPYEQKESTQNWFTEGEATFHSKFMFPLTANQDASWMIQNESGTRTINYGKTNGVGYMFNLYSYENLVYLAGYDTVQQVGHHDGVSLVRHTIAEKYGKQEEQSLWELLCYINDNWEKSWNTDMLYESAIRLQNMLLEFVKQDIQALDPHNPKAIKKYMDVYRNYKLKIMPSVQDEAYKLHTNEVFEIDAADELLIDKIEEAHLFSFSNNKGLNRMAIKSILYADNNSHGVPFGDYLPTTIHGTEYSYEEYRVGGEPRGRIKAVYPYDTESDSLIEMYFEFNETELLSIDNSLYD